MSPTGSLSIIAGLPQMVQLVMDMLDTADSEKIALVRTIKPVIII